MSASTRPPRWAWLTLAGLLTFHTLLAYGLPPSVPILGTAGLLVVYALVGAANAVAISLALVAGTLLYAGALALVDWEEAVYYRPEMRLAAYSYALDHGAYVPGQTLRMRVRQGDLQSMTTDDIAEPHEVVFRTDSRGFRNGRDYAGEPFVLVGDSFVAGVNNSQDDILSEQLRRAHGIAAYNLAFPGDVDDYLRYLAEFRAEHGAGAKALLFLFEGNDFPSAGEYEPKTAPGALHRAYKRWFGLFSGTGVYRFTSQAYKRWRHRDAIARGEFVQMGRVASRPAAFHRPYVEATRAPSYSADAAFTERLRAALRASERVFFLPTKYRVYPGAGEAPLPHARWEYLARICGEVQAKCTDLSGPLRAGAERLAARGEALWWRDDTHWNRAGIATAAAVIAQTLTTGP